VLETVTLWICSR